MPGPLLQIFQFSSSNNRYQELLLKLWILDGGNRTEHNQRVVEDCDVVIFSVKPQTVKDVVLQLRPQLQKKLLVFVSAGTKLKDLPEWAGHGRFIKVMPNTPAAVGVAASVVSLGAAATEEHGELISRLVGAIGKVWRADEKLFDAITGIKANLTPMLDSNRISEL
ncbi:hypothetical protein Ancab_032734 [Ancistrocladus abbreviatus]